MKKRICLLLALGVIFFTSLSAHAFCWKFWKKPATSIVVSDNVNTIVPDLKSKDFEILPTMNTISNAKNQVWVGTFQLIWNDLIDEIVKHPVQFVGVKSIMADNLNKKEFLKEDLDEASFYKKLGLASPRMKKEIEKGIKDKFNETSDILDAFDWNPAPDKYILYAMLKKDFEYIEPFDKLRDGQFVGSDGLVKYFGIDGNSSGRLRHTVGVLFYSDDNDYAVALKSKQGDTIYLYRTDDTKTFDNLYADLLTKSNQYNGDKWLSYRDEFKAPMIDFKSEREFPELCNKPIQDTDLMIAKAIETVQFKMDETGVKLKSEAGMMMAATSAGPGFVIKPRYFYFNNRYVIFMLDKDKSKPYFAMLVTDAKKIQK